MLTHPHAEAFYPPAAASTESNNNFTCYIAVPALNEASEIPHLIRSIDMQNADIPTNLVVADDGSTDGTADIVKRAGGTVVTSEDTKTHGVGAARQRANDRIRGSLTTDPEKTLLIQTDADCMLSPGYINAVVQAFQADPSMQVGVGPSEYTFALENGEITTLATAKEYGALLGTTGLRGYFAAANRNVEDYLLEPPFRYLVGVNTVFRASLLMDEEIRYPTDGRWETLDMSVRIQQRLPSSTAIRYVDGQRVHVSPRAILGGEPVLTANRLAAIRAAGYVGMYKETGVDRTPYASTRTIIDELDAKTYGLEPGQRILAIVNKDDPLRVAHASLPALHSATGQPIPNKFAVLGEA